MGFLHVIGASDGNHIPILELVIGENCCYLFLSWSHVYHLRHFTPFVIQSLLHLCDINLINFLIK